MPTQKFFDEVFFCTYVRGVVLLTITAQISASNFKFWDDEARYQYEYYTYLQKYVQIRGFLSKNTKQQLFYCFPPQKLKLLLLTSQNTLTKIKQKYFHTNLCSYLKNCTYSTFLILNLFILYLQLICYLVIHLNFLIYLIQSIYQLIFLETLGLIYKYYILTIFQLKLTIITLVSKNIYYYSVTYYYINTIITKN
eukprot:TRINITY_DN169_c0_g1_i10.p3 TRINITY_DN169_c0_g1~~TRINITY_DN169_c0_g1_i10.p3  ORF type:complete len:195 (+),score=-16.35 TRINITY_DN169_c0_g1_i10:684-1268(+)